MLNVMLSAFSFQRAVISIIKSVAAASGHTGLTETLLNAAVINCKPTTIFNHFGALKIKIGLYTYLP